MNDMNERKFDIEGAKEILAEKPVGKWLADGFQEIADGLKNGKKNIAKKFTCHKMALNLIPTEYAPETVKETRKKLKCSQAIFAQFMGVSLSAVRNWEQGVNSPGHASCRLMDEIRHDPEYWRKRFSQLAVRKSDKVELS
ncbi:MAG: hypothetical protein O2955_01735 [Planctomycetota bacterium]|nr:hypothetical protein [Planctomycetota bacterium]MDA1211204.1 hypothetical protein [Planctomycetota bacterium]